MAPVRAEVAAAMRRAGPRLVESWAVEAREFVVVRVSESEGSWAFVWFGFGVDSVETPRGEVVVEEGLVELVVLVMLVASVDWEVEVELVAVAGA